MGTLRVSGNLDAVSVPVRLRESAGWFQAGHELTIDLAGISRADSAGVALLLDWQRQARAARTQLTFANAPQQMRTIIAFCELGDIVVIDDPVDDTVTLQPTE